VTLASRLDSLYEAYNREDAAADPIQIVRRYTRRDDQEVVGFCAAALAFGRVASVLNTVETLTRIMGAQPAAYVRAFEPDAPHPELRGMVHRWTRGTDIAALLWILRQMIDRQVSRLAMEEQQLLEAASVAGVEFSASSAAATPAKSQR